jgi:polysaccharide export outer membrane protein
MANMGLAAYLIGRGEPDSVTNGLAPYGLLLLSVAGCAPQLYDYSKEPDPRRHEYVIGVADGLRINVWRNAELSTQATVRPDGTITMPLIGDLQASGRTPGQLKEEIVRRLRTYIKDEAAVVSIAITDVNSYRFTVAGNVEKGGIFSTKYYVTVAEAIAMAGGLNKFATPKKLVLVRPQTGAPPRRIPIDYERIGSGGHPEENLVMLTGDTLYAN